MNAVKYRVVSGVVWTNRTMVSSNTDTNRTGVLAVVFIDSKRVYTEITFAIGSEFIRYVLNDSAPITDLKGNKKRIPYCQMWGNIGTAANEQTSECDRGISARNSIKVWNHEERDRVYEWFADAESVVFFTTRSVPMGSHLLGAQAYSACKRQTLPETLDHSQKTSKFHPVGGFKTICQLASSLYTYGFEKCVKRFLCSNERNCYGMNLADQKQSSPFLLYRDKRGQLKLVARIFEATFSDQLENHKRYNLVSAEHEATFAAVFSMSAAGLFNLFSTQFSRGLKQFIATVKIHIRKHYCFCLGHSKHSPDRESPRNWRLLCLLDSTLYKQDEARRTRTLIQHNLWRPTGIIITLCRLVGVVERDLLDSGRAERRSGGPRPGGGPRWHLVSPSGARWPRTAIVPTLYTTLPSLSTFLGGECFQNSGASVTCQPPANTACSNMYTDKKVQADLPVLGIVRRTIARFNLIHNFINQAIEFLGAVPVPLYAGKQWRGLGRAFLHPPRVSRENTVHVKAAGRLGRPPNCVLSSSRKQRWRTRRPISALSCVTGKVSVTPSSISEEPPIEVKARASMPRRRQRAPYQRVNEFERCRMIGLRETGLSYRDISALTGQAATAVMSVWNQWIEEDRTATSWYWTTQCDHSTK
ncbi:hypothetical protein PR048_032161 [Dryococelus australis]|uniref:Uncharacterized protein n=1 Tax=Dryococelus australis TaxID=614101 RepID=A0ABQ9G1F1_9NEOP|nr:hypothetical protein PR048_032161 [Dryococelus australis]